MLFFAFADVISIDIKMAPKAATPKPDPSAMAVPKTPRKRSTAMKATTPKKGATPNSSSRLAESDQLLFLWTCLRHKGETAVSAFTSIITLPTLPSPQYHLAVINHVPGLTNSTQVDYGAVAADLGISKNAAYKRWTKLKGVCERLEAADQLDRDVEGQRKKEAGGKVDVEDEEVGDE